MSYSYEDVKLTCPFCKSNMELEDILITKQLKIPLLVDYFCTNDKCGFSLRIDFDEFKKRTKEIKEIRK